MTTAVDEGGKPPCWAHLFESPIDDIEDSGDVERIVRDFCRQATMDDLLGPVFAAAGIMRNAYIETLVESWSWQLFGVRGYAGNPVRAYQPVHARTPFTVAHYARWRDLFDDTIDSLFVGPVAELAKARARKVAAAMGRLLADVSDVADAPVEVVWPGTGDRCVNPTRRCLPKG